VRNAEATYPAFGIAAREKIKATTASKLSTLVANKPEDCKSPPWPRRQQRPDPARRPPPLIERNTAMGPLSSGQGPGLAVLPTAKTREI